MEPTIQSNDLIIVERLSPQLEQLHSGDIVVLRSPQNPLQHICKRITGTAGDRIGTGVMEVKVPKGHVWLEGDNHDNSTDSWSYGPVPIALIHGRAFYKISPFGPFPPLV